MSLIKLRPRSAMAGWGFFFTGLVLVFLWACETAPIGSSNGSSMPVGEFNLVIAMQDEDVPVILSWKDGVAALQNGDERVILDSTNVINDTLVVTLSVFESELRFHTFNDSLLQGNWHNLRKGKRGIHSVVGRPNNDLKTDEEWVALTPYQLDFSPQTSDYYPAIGLFKVNRGELKGTILTETGDYRYLNGSIAQDSSFVLHTFDGAHLFHFRGRFSGDSIVNGVFKSSKSWKEPFTGIKDAKAHLKNPDDITTVVKDAYSFTVKDTAGREISFSAHDFEGRVSIVQILGTWCPNCLDETEYYKQLQAKVGKQHLTIIPVAFEAYDSFDKNVAAISKFKRSLNLPYDFYIGGKANKEVASKVFNMIDEVRSFPTSIIIDKKGKIRKVHTGFYGPSTGQHYEHYASGMDQFITDLIAEI